MAKDYCLAHHGILGQKWGIRRFQNKDGSYTAEGKKRRNLENDNKVKKAIKVGAAIVGTALVAYGTYKAYDMVTKRADLVLLGRNIAQKQKVEAALKKFDNRSALAERMSLQGQDTSQIYKDVQYALNEYNQHKNLYDTLDSEYRKMNNIEKIKKANNLLKFNESHGRTKKETIKYFEELVSQLDKSNANSKPLTKSQKDYINNMW